MHPPKPTNNPKTAISMLTGPKYAAKANCERTGETAHSSDHVEITRPRSRPPGAGNALKLPESRREVAQSISCSSQREQSIALSHFQGWNMFLKPSTNNHLMTISTCSQTSMVPTQGCDQTAIDLVSTQDQGLRISDSIASRRRICQGDGKSFKGQGHACQNVSSFLWPKFESQLELDPITNGYGSKLGTNTQKKWIS